MIIKNTIFLVCLYLVALGCVITVGLVHNLFDGTCGFLFGMVAKAGEHVDENLTLAVSRGLFFLKLMAWSLRTTAVTVVCFGMFTKGFTRTAGIVLILIVIVEMLFAPY